jgi:hypothetical protein
LALRLDQDEIGESLSALGKNIGLPAAPLQCLSAVAQNKPAVLFIDQLDAIRWTSRHSASSWDTISQLVRSGVATSNVTVVLACRTYDANNDPRIQSMIESLQRNGSGFLKIDALPISLEALDAILRQSSSCSSQLSPKQREILRLRYCATMIQQDL